MRYPCAGVVFAGRDRSPGFIREANTACWDLLVFVIVTIIISDIALLAACLSPTSRCY
jgi:hypothetical protein